MLLQPQALAQHLVHGVAHRVVVAAGDRLDLGAGGAQARFQAVGSVQQLAHGTLALAATAAQHDQDNRDGCGCQQQREGQGQRGQSRRQASSLPRAAPVGKFPRHTSTWTAITGLTQRNMRLSILRLMSVEVPEVVDAWRMVAARRGFEGRLPLSSMERLGASLFDSEGEVVFALEFDRDALQVPYVEVRIEAALPLQCQRTLQRFEYPLRILQRMGLLAADADDSAEAALPPEYEALQVAEDGSLKLAELIEDELILALPVVPVAPGSESVERDWPAPADEQMRANPFAVLAGIKKPDPH